LVNGYSPEATRYIQQAEHNHSFTVVIDKENYKDWFITGCFYMAVHYVNAYASFRGHKFERKDKDRDKGLHFIRYKYVKDKLPELASKYKRLWDESENARYDPLYFKRFKGDLDKHLGIALMFSKIV